MLRIRSFRDWPIGRKLTALFVAMAFATAGIIVVTIGVFDLWGLEQAMIRDMATLAEVLGRNSTAAITFHDADVAGDVLQALQAEPGITAACIYTEDGKPLATYARPGLEHYVPPHIGAEDTRFDHWHLILFRNIRLKNEIVGTIYIESDLRKLEARFREYAAAILIALVLTMAFAFPLASRHKRPISQPVFSFVRTVRRVRLFSARQPSQPGRVRSVGRGIQHHARSN
jgi:two-component system sensor histidine kinase/response regulator